MSEQRGRHLVVAILDTNCLFTEAADQLFSKPVSDVIEFASGLHDVTTRFMIPSIVRDERKYQMLKRGVQLLPQLEKIERLLGHKLGISEEVLQDRIEAIVAREMKAYGVDELSLDCAKVDWASVIDAAAYRKAPFDAGEKEKGFRDAVFVQSCLQYIADAPKSAQTRIVLVSGDKLVQDALEGATRDRKNVRMATGIDELRSQLNIISSQVTEETVAKMVPLAAQLFFTNNENKDTLYYKENIWKRIVDEFWTGTFAKAPTENATVITKAINIGPTAFVSKRKQRVTFSTKIVVTVEATGRRPPTPAGGGLADAINLPQTGLAAAAATSLAPKGLFGLLPAGATPQSGESPSLGEIMATYARLMEVKHRGTHSVEVTWQATLTSRGQLSRSAISGTRVADSKWEELPPTA